MPKWKEEIPPGYIKAYNPILVGAALLITVQTIFYTLFTVYVYSNPDMPERMIQAFNIWTNMFQVGISVGLWYTTYKYARISEEPLQKLRRLAYDAEQFIDIGETVLEVFAPFFAWLKTFKEKSTLKPMTKEELEEQIARMQIRLEKWRESEGWVKKEKPKKQ